MSLEREFSYYLAYQQELAKEYEGQFLIIRDQKVVGAYKDRDEALDNALGEYELGDFLLQECLSDPESTVAVFRSRVAFV